MWVAVHVVGRYADPAICPGPEHLGLAALIAEDVASDFDGAYLAHLPHELAKDGKAHIGL